ncbi:unnamed protein product [Linum tenue]|uniref:Uncharacterized protein n=1 Tax=Linum tenue TaxID=586396 RepID=A0AAV0JZX8_9ROSI|nr:unnamed protein product [Linum tenue]
MVLFNFKSDKHFVTSSDKTTLRVCELSDPTVHPSRIRKAHWREVGCIIVDTDDDRDVDDLTEEQYYDGLSFFDGHGKIEGQEALTKLAQHLARLGLMVSPGGYCFQDVTELNEHKEFGIHYLRLNDLFSWSHHGVGMSRITMWRRLELKYDVPKHKKIPKSSLMVGGAISKEKYEELKRMLNEKKEELKKVTTEMEDEIQKLRDGNDEELQKVQQEMEAAIDKRDAELRKVKKEKGEELRKLRKEKDEEIRKLRREMHDEVERLEREKDEEVAKLEESDETTHEPAKEEELKMLRREANDSKKREKEKDEELLKLKRELEDLRRSKKEEEGHHRLEKEEEKKDKEALQQLIMEKDGKLQELGKVREQLLGKVEQCSKYSWSRLPSYNCGDLVKLRKRVPRENFEKASGLDRNQQHLCHRYVPHILTSSAFARQYVDVVDDVSRDDWPPPPRIQFSVGNNGQFDVDNWWFLKTTHPEGGTTMLGYYDGSLSICPDAAYSCNTRLPFPRGCDFCASRNFFLTCLDAQEWRLAFTYRE